MTSYTVSHASPTASTITPTVHAVLDMPCLLHDERDNPCGRPVRFVVDEWDVSEDQRRHLIQFGACDEHTDLYR